MKKNNLKGSAILCLAAFVWGLAFTAQSVASVAAPPFMINTMRSAIAALFLYLLAKVRYSKKGLSFLPKEPKKRKNILFHGFVCGLLLAVAVNFQQFGFILYPKDVPVEARVGFLTSLYVVMVPLIVLIYHKKSSIVSWVSALVALAGVYLLCFLEGEHGLYAGDVLILLCALGCSLHIIHVDHVVKEIGGLRLSVLQFVFCAVISGMLSLGFEFTGILWDKIIWADVLSVMPEILYLGLVSSGIGYTLQIVGQIYADAAVASLSMSLEGVFAALGGWLIMGHGLTVREIIGCIFVFFAIVIAQIPDFIKKPTGSKQG